MARKPFKTEPEGYQRGPMSDLQGAFELLRETVAKAHPFPGSDRILFHVDEAMCWESVRDLDRMKTAILLVRNLVVQNKVPAEIEEWMEGVANAFDEVEAAISESEGEKI